MNKEIWKDIYGFDKYQVSNLGNVRRYNKSSEYDKRIAKYIYLKPQKLKSGYLQISLYKNAKQQRKTAGNYVWKYERSDVYV